MTFGVARLPGIDPMSEGIARVDADELRSALGHTAAHVWSILCELRDYHGMVHVTIGGIARARGYVRITPRAAKAALAKLRRAHLVRDVGWVRCDVPCKRSRRHRRVFLREVFGKLSHETRHTRIRTWADVSSEHSSDVVAVVPRETEAWMMGANRWGGRRKGAGRKGLQNERETKGVFSSVSGDRFSSVSPDQVVSKKEGRRTTEESTPNGVDAAPRRSVSSWDEGSLGTLIGSTDAPSSMLLPYDTPITGVPPYPGISIVKPARIPAPPRLDPAADDLALAKCCLDAYRSAVAHRTKKPCHILARGDLRRSKHYRTLVAGARKLLEHEIPPTSWALWSCDIWPQYGGGSKRKGSRPALSWVFSPKRIDERRGWFRREAQSYTGSRLVFGNAHKALLRRYEAMRRELRVTEEPVAAVVARFFPPEESYEKWVRHAQDEAERTRLTLERMMAKGVFLW